jgi:hypothetical protein
MDKENLPIVGQEYNCYDDGKIRPSRRYTVKIKEIIPFAEASSELRDKWEFKSNTCSWLFSHKTDYFIIADSYEKSDEVEEAVFVRTVAGNWFSMGEYWCSGFLDVDGALTKEIREEYENGEWIIKEEELKYYYK